MAESLVIGALITSCLALAVVSWLARIVARLAGFPFGAMNWLLHGLGFLVTLPFVLTLLVLTNGLGRETWWIGGSILALALISVLGGGVKLLLDLMRGEGHAVRSRGFIRR